MVGTVEAGDPRSDRHQPARRGLRSEPDTRPALASKPAWIAVAILLVNDIYLKFAFPSTITGKLSDVAELFVLPLAVVVVALSIAAGTPRRATAISAAVYASIGAVFIAMKTDVGFATAIRASLGP